MNDAKQLTLEDSLKQLTKFVTKFTTSFKKQKIEMQVNVAKLIEEVVYVKIAQEKCHINKERPKYTVEGSFGIVASQHDSRPIQFEILPILATQPLARALF